LVKTPTKDELFVQMMKFMFSLPLHQRSQLTTSREGTQVEFEFVNMEVPISERRMCKTVQLQLITGEMVELTLFDVEQFDMANGHVLIMGRTPDLPEPISLPSPSSMEEWLWKQ
jgi:hypothetical protein